MRREVKPLFKPMSCEEAQSLEQVDQATEPCFSKHPELANINSMPDLAARELFLEICVLGSNMQQAPQQVLIHVTQVRSKHARKHRKKQLFHDTQQACKHLNKLPFHAAQLCSKQAQNKLLFHVHFKLLFWL